MKIKIYADPGHAWAAVKKNVLADLGIDGLITPYSYQRGQTAYLEEDVDLGTLLMALRARGVKPVFEERITDRRSPIRSYDRYTLESA